MWGHVVLEVDVRTLLPKTEKYYNDGGELMRVMTFSE